MPVLPDEEYQRIRSNLLFPPELDLSPKQTRELFLDNIFRRSLSLITGLSPTGEKVLVATPAGILKVAITGAGYDVYEVKATTSTNDYSPGNTLTPGALSSRWDILVETRDIIIHFRNTGDTGYDGDIILQVGTYSFDYASLAVQWKSRLADNAGEVQVVAFR